MNSLDTLTKNGNLVLLLVEDADHPLYDYQSASDLHWTVGFNATDCGPKTCDTQIIGWDWEEEQFILTEGIIRGWKPLPPNPYFDDLNSMEDMPKDGTMVLVYVTKNDYSFDSTRNGWMVAVDWSDTHDEGLQVCGWDYDSDDINNLTNVRADDTLEFHGWLKFPQTISDDIGSSDQQFNTLPEQEMTLHDFFSMFDYKVTEGSEFYWNCFGPNCRFIELKNNEIGGCVVFSKEDQEILQAEVYDEAKNVAYRWMPPSAKEKYFTECEVRNVPKMEAWEGCDFIDVETVNEFSDIVKSLIQGEPLEGDFEGDMDVELELPHHVIVFLSLEAHKRNITLNEMINIVLRDMLTKIENGEIDLNNLGETK